MSCVHRVPRISPRRSNSARPDVQFDEEIAFFLDPAILDYESRIRRRLRPVLLKRCSAPPKRSRGNTKQNGSPVGGRISDPWAHFVAREKFGRGCSKQTTASLLLTENKWLTHLFPRSGCSKE